jgi:hypothetical protein
VGKGIMKKFFLVILLVVFAAPIHAMSGKPKVEPDPECFSSDKIRVEIGGKKFAFPREIIRMMKGNKVINTKGKKYKGSASGRKACQKPNDKNWVLTSIGLDLHPEPCPGKQSNCNTNRFSTMIEDLDYRRNRGAVEDVFPRTKQELHKECKAPKKPLSDFHAKVWSSCDFAFEEKKLHIWIKFRGGIYSPDNIDSTKQLIINEIYKYSIE